MAEVLNEKQQRKVSDVLEKAVQKSSNLFRVYLQAAPDHHLAPFMDRPRVFQCEKGDAVECFKKFYGIIATVHSFVVEPASEEEWYAQVEDDKRRM
jgi:hypothetical protein